MGWFAMVYPKKFGPTMDPDGRKRRPWQHPATTTSKAEWGSEMNVQMMDFMKPPGTTRGQHGHVADGFRTTVQLIQYVILPYLCLGYPTF